MKVAYIYQESLDLKKANVYQAASMVNAYSRTWDLTYYRGWRSMMFLNKRIKQPRTINLGLNFSIPGFLEKVSRLVFSVHTLIKLRVNKPDLIITRDFGFLYLLSFAQKWLSLKIPIVYEMHKVYHRVSEKVSHEQEKKVLSIVDLIVTVSKGIKEDVIQDFDFESDKILVAYNGYSPTSFNNSFAKGNSKCKIVYAGSIEKWKGVEVLIEAANILSKEHYEIHLICKGRYEDLRALQQKSVNVIWHPPMDREVLLGFIPLMDIGVIPTLDKQEGSKYTSPIKLQEYIQSGLKVIASDTPALREVEELGFKISYFKVGDPVSLAESLISMHTDRSQEKYTLKNQALLKEFTWENRAHKIMNWVCIQK